MTVVASPLAGLAMTGLIGSSVIARCQASAISRRLAPKQSPEPSQKVPQILPLRIHAVDQLDLLFPASPLDQLLLFDSLPN